ncbi:hypothetical protein FS837_009404 [Tulasnella sp. UAMH 9824]|nr:hypothetical protein FS837_009404 [Tulasnella sp. UAMH 9824]
MGTALSSALQVADTADPENLRWFIAQPIEGGSEKGATTPAASVSFDTKSSVRSLSKHPIHYYADGDVAFIVEDYVFRLHRSILEAQSNAMKDLYSIGEVHGKADKIFDDVIAVRLNDSPKDFSNVLDIVYKRRRTSSSRTSSDDQSAGTSSSSPKYPANLKLGDLVGVIRVAWKYELEDIANDAISQLDHLLPLTQPQDIQKLSVYKADSGLAIAANVINLSRECQLPRFAPMAFYALATAEWTTDDFQALSSVFPILSAQMHLRLNAGRVGLQKAVMERVVTSQERCSTCSSKPWPDPAQVILHPLETLRQQVTEDVDGSPGACAECSEPTKTARDKLLQDVLRGLPSFFNLE